MNRENRRRLSLSLTKEEIEKLIKTTNQGTLTKAIQHILEEVLDCGYTTKQRNN